MLYDVMVPLKEYLIGLLSAMIILFLIMPVLAVNNDSAHYEGHNDTGVRNSITDTDIKEIIFDESHRQWWSLWDTGFIGYSDLAILLEGEGYLVSANTAPLEYAIVDKGEGDVLVLGMAYQESFRDEEIQAILDFTERGGGLLIMSEHEMEGATSWYTSAFLNPLAENFGIHFNSNEVDDVGSSHPDYTIWPIADSKFLGVEDFCLYFTNSMNLSGNAIAIANTTDVGIPPNAPIVAASSYGDGRIIAVTDTEFIWNGDEVIGLQYGNDTEFTLSIFKWLSGKENTNEHKIIPEYDLITAEEFRLNVTVTEGVALDVRIEGGEIGQAEDNGNDGRWVYDVTIQEDGFIEFRTGESSKIVYLLSIPKKTMASVLFDGRSHTRNVDDSPSGMLSMAKRMRDNGIRVFSSALDIDHKKYDAVMIVNPLQMPSNTTIDPDTKYILMSDSYTLLYLIDWPDKYLHETKESPINEYASQFGLSFPYYTIYDPSPDSITEGFNPSISHSYGFNMKAYKSGILLSEANMTVLAEASSTAWGERLDVGARDGYEKDSQDYSNADFCMYDNNVMGISDTDPFTNNHYGEEGTIEFIDSISSWIILYPKSDKYNGFFGQTLEFNVPASPGTEGVQVNMADGKVVNLKKSSSGKWSGKYYVPLDGVPGNYTAVIMTQEYGENGIIYDIDYTIDEINPWPPYKILALLVLIGSIFITIFYAVKKRGKGNEKKPKKDS